MRRMSDDEEVALLLYVETEADLDLNSSGDLLIDLFQFSKVWVAEGGGTAPVIVWRQFIKSPVGSKYFLLN